jgi:Fur family transcriptional regulator, zinc uptake regulator
MIQSVLKQAVTMYSEKIKTIALKEKKSDAPVQLQSEKQSEKNAYDLNLELLKKEGFRITPQRMDILKFISKKKGSITAELVFRNVRKKHSGISLDTVYRTLSTFASLGILDRVNLLGSEVQQFIFNDHSAHGHHAICIKCGESVAIDLCPFEEHILKNLTVKNFRVLNHTFEVYGYCKNCN